MGKRRINVCKCEVCGVVFYSVRWGAKTCSSKCRKKKQRQDPSYIEPRDRQGRAVGVVSHNRRVCDTALPDVAQLKLADLDRLIYEVKL